MAESEASLTPDAFLIVYSLALRLLELGPLLEWKPTLELEPSRKIICRN